jgi:hypothetical protein
MRMKNLFSRQCFVIVGLLLALFAAAFFYSRSRAPLLSTNEKGETHGDIVAASPPSTPLVARASNNRSATNPPRLLTVSSSSEEEDATISVPADRPRFVGVESPAQRRAGANDVDLRKASTSLRDYRMAFHQNPVGNNKEITRTLSGKNSRGIRYLPPDAHINEKGQLTDYWDQPVFFHQISSAVMEVRSAGPDRVMWTADDEVLR